MKAINQIPFLLLILILNDSCKHNEPNFGQVDELIISGQIIDYMNNGGPAELEFSYVNIVSSKLPFEKKRIEVNDRGEFKAKLIIPYTCELNSNYGKLLCSPGDSLYLTIDTISKVDLKCTKNCSPYYIKDVSGTSAKTNRDIIKFLKQFPDDQYVGDFKNEAIYSKTPQEYRLYIVQREQEYRDYYENFISENKVSELFKKWALNTLNYESWVDLLRYSWMHPYFKKNDYKDFKLPEDYFAFLENYDTNDNELFSQKHAMFLQELWMKSIKDYGNSLNIENETPDLETKIKVVNGAIEMFNSKYSDFTKELFITKYYLLLIDGEDIELVDKCLDTSSISSYFASILNSEYQRLKGYLANVDTKEANLSVVNTTNSTTFIDSITEKYANKVIYIDFWAPWCSPCMSEMPFSKDIQKYYENKDIVFLFMANRCKEKNWKATIANKNLSGEHILLNNDQYKEMTRLFGISGIPHYALINRKGEIAQYDAPRPSNRKRLIDEIDKLLK